MTSARRVKKLYQVALLRAPGLKQGTVQRPPDQKLQWNPGRQGVGAASAYMAQPLSGGIRQSTAHRAALVGWFTSEKARQDRKRNLT